MRKPDFLNVGERIAEKLRDENVIRGFVNWERIAEIANQEIAASQRNTDAADSILSAETGEALSKRITSYLVSGGLFNPEMAIHDRVRDLLIKCRSFIDTLGDQAHAKN